MFTRLTILGVLLLATVSAAQSRPQRAVVLDHMAFFLAWFPERTPGSVEVRVLGMTGTPVVPVDVAVAGSAWATDSGSFFVSGRDGDAGVVQFVAYDAQTETFSRPTGARYTEVGSDFVGVAWDEQTDTVYALDAGKNRIVAFLSYVLGDPLPAPVTVLNASAFPGLATADHLTLGIGEAPGRLVVYEHGTMVVEEDHWVLTPGTQGWTTEFRPGLSRASHLSPDELTVGATEVTIEGPPGVPVEVVKISGAARTVSVVGTATTDGQGSAVVALGSPLELGEVYATRNHSYGPEVQPPYASPVYRWGTVESIGAHVSMQPLGGGLALLSYLGNGRFEVPLFASVSDLNAAPAQFTVSLAVGTPADVTQVNGRDFLAAPVVIDATLNIFKAGFDGGLASVPLPIPVDDALVGAVICYQWWVQNGAQSVALSNIVGIPIRGFRFVPFGLEEFFGDASTGSVATPGSNHASADERRAAVHRWLLDCGARELSREDLRRIRARLRD